MNHPSGLLSLNDDVLLATFSFLDPKAALATASTSKSAYRLAISFVFVDLSWGRTFNADSKEDGSESLALSQYMCAPEPLSQVPRIEHLRHLGLGHGIHEVDLPPLHNLLCQAFNLRTIQIANFESFIDEDGPVIQAIGAMQHLEQARFMLSGPATISALPTLLSSQKLTSLTLDFDSTYYEEDIVDLPALLSGLSSARSIRTLSIGFSFIPNAPLMRSSHNPALPSIRHLTLSSLAGPVPAYIITLCPNIDTLSLTLFPRDTPCATFYMTAEDRWPARLKELDLPYCITIAEDTVKRMKPAYRLSFGGSGVIYSGDVFERYLQPLKTFSPTALELRTKKFLVEADRMWDSLRGAARQLRSLSIVVAPDGEYNVREYVVRPLKLPVSLRHNLPILPRTLQDPLIAALRSTALVHLSLHLPPAGLRIASASPVRVDDLCAAEVRRVEALRALPPLLSEAVPSLRVFALSSCKPSALDFDIGPFRTLVPPVLIAELEREKEIRQRWGPSSEFLNASMRKMEELREEIARNEQWWWVEGEGAARTPVEIWREDGERARDLIKRADFDPKRGLDGFYSDKCRYER